VNYVVRQSIRRRPCSFHKNLFQDALKTEEGQKSLEEDIKPQEKDLLDGVKGGKRLGGMVRRKVTT